MRISISDTDLQLSWTNPASLDGIYKVERKIGVGGSYSQIGEVDNGTLSFIDAGTLPGTNYYYRIKSDNYYGEAVSSEVSPPSISVTNPLSGSVQSYCLPDNLAASASDSDGTVTQVQFFAGTNLLGTATNSPYTFAWTNALPDTSYVVTATAWDNAGNSRISAPVSILVLRDSDGNGLDDCWEIQYFGHLGVDPNGDPDGDGVNNYLEYLLGRNPLVSEAPPPNGGVNLQVYTPLR